MQEEMKHFFHDLNVVELSSVLAGPAVGMFFAELGANVIKIENKTTNGDVTRNWITEADHQSVSSYFASINYGKEHLFLDLTQPEDKTRLREHIQESDVVITNMKQGDDVKLGLTCDYFKSIKNDIIQCQLYGFESEKSRPAFDAVLQAETGFMYMNGQPNSPPTKFPVAFIDMVAAHQMKEAILIALLKREKTGAGSYIEVTLEEAGIASLVNQATNWLMNNQIPERTGSLHPSIAPYGETYKCNDDKWLVLAVGNDRQFASLLKVLSLDHLSLHPDYATNANRVLHRIALNKILERSFRSEDRADVSTRLKSAGVPVGEVKTMKEVFEGSTAKKMVLEEEIEGAKTLRPSSIGFRFLA